MDKELAKKAVREAKEMHADHISFHVTGESLNHPDLFEILPCDTEIGLSTNCLSLTGEKAERLRRMENLRMILAVLWTSDVGKRELSCCNAIEYLESDPKNKSISLQMVTERAAEAYAVPMYKLGKSYFKKVPQLKLMYKQPYTQEKEYPTYGFIPDVPEGKRVTVDRMLTPQSCGTDCLAIAPNPMTSLLIQSDGEIKPCFKRVDGTWGLGNIRCVSLKEAWHSYRLAEIRSHWYHGDPDNIQACHDCIRMAEPKEGMWYQFNCHPPTKLDANQKKKAGNEFPGYMHPK
jgi:radical SAM protein with 4Fe4S-binding SPASM domain